MKQFDLTQVVEAINTTVLQAQAQLEEHQVKLFDKYFKDDGTAKSQAVKLKTEEGKDKIVEFPLVCLIPPVSLQMTNLSMSMKVPIVSTLPVETTESKDKKTPKVDSLWGEIDKDYLADLQLSFDTTAPNPALVKINELLLKNI
jgi:hypothetical protein